MANINPDFRNRVTSALDDSFNKKLMAKMPRVVRGMQHIKNFTGEYQSTLINAFGTSFIASIVISKNPISKADQAEKDYSAWRQVISGAIAVAASTGAVIPVNRFMEKLSANGYLPENLNKVVVHDEKILAREIKKANPNLSKKEIAQKAKEKQMDEYAKAMQQIYDEGILSCENHKLTPEKFKELLKATCSDMAKETDKKLQHFQETLTEKYLQRMTYFKENSDSVKEMFSAIEKHLATNPTKAESKKFFKELNKKYGKKSPAIQEVITEIATGQDTKIKQSTLDGIKKHFTDISTQKLNNEQAIRNYITKSIKEEVEKANQDKEVLKGAERLIDQINKTNAKDQVKEIVNHTNKLLQNGRDFLFNVVDKEVKTTAKRYKSYKDGMGIIIGLIMLPITCKTLNWIHPRFMEKFFPDIVEGKNNKKAEGENK